MKTYNVKLVFEKNDDKQSLISSLSFKRDAFNEISKVRFGMKTCNGIMPLHQKCYRAIRNQFPTLPSQFVIKAEQDVIAKYKSIRTNQHKITEPVSTSKLNIQLDKRIYTWIGNDAIKLTTCNGRIIVNLAKYDKVNELFGKYECKDPSLFAKDNEIYLSIVFDNTVSFQDNNKYIGIDLGIKRVIATSEGNIIKGNEFNNHKRKIRWNKRKLQSKQRHSHSARIKLKKLSKREYNFSSNYIHHVVNNVLKIDASTIIIEDLNKIKSKNNGKRLNNRLSQMPFYMLKTILTYKAQALGKRVEMVKPHYTSQLDYRGLDNGVRKGCRYYASDGIVLDADLNAANNILLRGSKHSVSCCKALDGQAVVNQPIVAFSKRQTPIPLG